MRVLSFLAAIAIVVKLAAVELDYQQDLILGNCVSMECAEEQAQCFCDAAANDPEIKVVNIRYVEEKESENFTFYKAIISCHVSETDKVFERVCRKVAEAQGAQVADYREIENSSPNNNSNEIVQKIPDESVMLYFPDGMIGNWKEIQRFVNEKLVSIRMIPRDQNIDFKDSIYIQFADKSIVTHSLKECVDMLKDKFSNMKNNRRNEIVVIELSENSALVEIHNFDDEQPDYSFNELCRFIMTDKGLHTIGFTKFGLFSADEKENCIKILRENAKIVETAEIKDLKNTFSIINRCREGVDVGPFFKNWKLAASVLVEQGVAIIVREPAYLDPNIIYEKLSVSTAPLLHTETDLEKLFQGEQEWAKNKIAQPKFDILKNEPKEKIFVSINCAGLLYVTMINRSFLTTYGACTCTRYIESTKEPEFWQLAKWRKEMEEIQTKDRQQNFIPYFKQ